MAECRITSHVTVANADKTIGGETIKEGQAYVVADKPIDPTGGGGAGEVSLNLCKIASFNLNERFRVYKIADASVTVQGTDLTTIADSNQVISDGTDFIAAGVTTEMDFQIVSGNDQGSYGIIEVAPFGLANSLKLDASMTDTASNLSWEITPEFNWKVDYSNAIFASIAPGSNVLRYLPFMGPGDHKGTFGNITATGPTVFTAADGNFQNVDNPVLVGESVEIKGGPDAGFYEITAVLSPQVLLVVNASWSADQTNLAWHIGKTSPHASVCRLHAVDGVNVVIPEENSVEVKIKSAIRDLADAQALDAQQEDPGSGFTAVDLFNQHGQFLACYRLQTTADESGNPLDDRIIIHARPWRGHDVDGVLFEKSDGTQKYTGSALNPVFPIRWLRDGWRLEISVARDTRQQPTPAEECN